MSIREILLVPAKGYTDAEGRWNVGRVIGTMFEVDIINEFTESVIEGLDNESLPWSILETRKTPGVPVPMRGDLVEPDTLVLQLAMGYTTHKSPTKNYSHVVGANTPGNYSIAVLLHDVMQDWGRMVSFSHSAMSPSKDPTDLVLNNPAGSAAFTLMPYQINGFEASEYYRRLPLLGRNLAIALKQWFKDQGISIGSRPVKIGPHREHAWSEPDANFAPTYFESDDADEREGAAILLGAPGPENQVADSAVSGLQVRSDDAGPEFFEDVEIVEPTEIPAPEDHAEDRPKQSKRSSSKGKKNKA